MPGTLAATWIGHATTVIDVDGTRVLTDPLLTRRVAHLRRHHPLDPVVLVDVDAVVVSHAHLDHLHQPSLRQLDPSVPVVVPRGAGPLARRAGAQDVVEVSAGDSVHLGGVDLLAVPAAHRRRRGPHSRVQAEPVGFVVDSGVHRAYFAGDTDLFPEMRDLVDIDLALLPIWGWGPSIGAGHLDPGRAATATQWIDPAVVVPIHWGTYSPWSPRPGPPAWLPTPAARFAHHLREAGLEHRLRILQPGESAVLVG